MGDLSETETGYLRSLESAIRSSRYLDREHDRIRRSYARGVVKKTPKLSPGGLRQALEATSMGPEAVVRHRLGEERKMRGDFLMTEVKARQAELLREAEEYRRFSEAKRDRIQEPVPVGRTKAYFYRKALSAAAIALVLSTLVIGIGI